MAYRCASDAYSRDNDYQYSDSDDAVAIDDCDLCDYFVSLRCESAYALSCARARQCFLWEDLWK